MALLEASVGQHFAFATGRTAVLQQLLLAQSDVDRLLGSHDLAECERIMTELKLTSRLGALPENADALLAMLEQWVRKEADSMAPESKRPVFDILWMDGDLPFLAYFLKKHHGLTSPVSAKPERGVTSFDTALVETLVADGSAHASLPAALVAFVGQTKTLQNPAAASIDVLAMQYIADRQLALAKESGSKDILGYVRHRIDLTNIRTAVRLINGGVGDVAPSLLKGGLMPVASFGSTQESLRAAVSRSPYYAILGNDVFDLAKDAVLFERASARITAGDIGRMWSVPLTVEPAFAFAAIALAHIRLIRFIFIGKRNQLSPQEIKRVLPPFLPSTHYSA